MNLNEFAEFLHKSKLTIPDNLKDPGSQKIFLTYEFFKYAIQKIGYYVTLNVTGIVTILELIKLLKCS